MNLLRGVLLPLVLGALPAAPPQKAPKPGPGLKLPPSENRGRTGSYAARTKRPGNDYWIYVPKSYSEDNPAGIHLFFHGQNGQGGAPHFGSWAGPFLDRFNLIGINMQYQDGDNLKDPEGKAASAWEAVAQTIADYKVVEGRGVIASFSGGGVPHGILQRDHPNNGAPCGPAWPFCHSALYSSNFLTPVSSKVTPMSWFISVGKKEWGMGAPILGESQTARMAEVLREAVRGGSPDLFGWITGKGHTIEAAEVVASAEGFRRSDLAWAPFLYLPDWTEPELAPLARDANAGGVGRALRAAERLLSTGRPAEALRAKAERLRDRLAARAKAILELLRELAAQDPVLGEYYGKILLPRLGDLPEAKEAREALAEGRKAKGYARTLALFPPFEKSFRQFFRATGDLNPEQAPFLEQVRQTALEKSLLGRMAAQYLALQ